MTVPDYRAQVVGPDRLAALQEDAAVAVVDHRAALAASLRELLPTPSRDLLDDPGCWVYFPWRQAVLGLPGPEAFRRIRLDRNRDKITAAEQARLRGLRIGVVGLSVGHVIAHTLAMEGLCGSLRLADFDTVDLSNLNRIPASVFDLGANKAVVAARRIAELDPYLELEIDPDGLRAETMDAFLDGLDIVVEECDSLPVKLALRSAARSRGIPVLCETSDQGMLDVERFDLEPDRPRFHGLAAEAELDTAAVLPRPAQLDLLMRLVEQPLLSERMLASLPQVGSTLSTWPQLGSDVVLGGATVAAAVRRIGLGAPLPSGRVRIDLAAGLDQLREPLGMPTVT